jgi:hypothetical protein
VRVGRIEDIYPRGKEKTRKREGKRGFFGVIGGKIAGKGRGEKLCRFGVMKPF